MTRIINTERVSFTRASIFHLPPLNSFRNLESPTVALRVGAVIEYQSSETLMFSLCAIESNCILVCSTTFFILLLILLEKINEQSNEVASKNTAKALLIRAGPNKHEFWKILLEASCEGSKRKMKLYFTAIASVNS